MANPNSADSRAKKAADKKLAAALAAEAKAAAEMAAAGETIGTADKPVDGSINAGPVPSTHNQQTIWVDELTAIANRFRENNGVRLVIWRDLGAKLAEIAVIFLKKDKDGNVLVGKDGKPIKDNNAYGAWLKEHGLAKDELANPNTRAAAVWVCENWAEISKVPACMRHGHPGHARDAYTKFKGALADAKDAYEGDDDFDEAAFAEGYDAPKASGGGSAGHSAETYVREIRSLMAKDPTVLETLKPQSVNHCKAIIILLRQELAAAKREIVKLNKVLDASGFEAAAPKAKAKAKEAKPAEPKDVTENGDERVPGEVAMWQDKASKAAEEPVDGDFEEVGPAPLSLPAPVQDASEAIPEANAEASEDEEV